MRNLTKALAVVSLLAPATGLPLSVGDIELHSTLNQALNAEIRLQVAPGENPSDVSVRLAPPEKFDQAGIPWSYFLSRIKFKPVVQADGSIIVKVTSQETLTEPFLDLLLEVSWPQGSQFREFTVLVDPPAAYNQPAVQPSGYRVEPLEEYERPIKRARPSARKAKSVDAASAITPQTPTRGEYGPVQQSDTLWRIATQLGEERGVPAKQMMAALYKANPEAFSRNDMNSLQAGAVLKIPETEAILKPSQKPTAEKAVAKEAGLGVKPLELVAPVDSTIAEKAVVGGKPGQKVGEAGSKPATGEAGKAAEGKDLELQARIDKLEQQLAMMQQLLSLKDQQLATLQGAGKVGPEGKPLPVPEPSVVPDDQAPTGEPAAPQPQPVEPTPPEVTQPPVVPVPAPEPKPAPVAQPAPAPVPAPAEEESVFVSDAYYVTMGGLGAGILGVLGWLLWRRRKIEAQTNTESMFASASEIRMPDSESSLTVPAMELGSSSSYDVGTVGESSFISDFTPSDFDAFDTEQSEVDPLSEADVYLAYGRYQQAEELIRHALVTEPGRDDFKLKLLEIFYACENKEGFESYAQELAAEGKQTDRAFWSKVADMAKEIVPDSPLFGGKPSAVPPAAIEETVEEERAQADIGGLESEFGIAGDESDELDLSVPAADDAAVLEELNAEFADLKRDFVEESKLDDNGLDFDLGLSLDVPAKPATHEDGVSADIESIDFDLGSLALDVTEKAKGSEDTDTLETFDFNFDVDKSAKPAADAASSSDLGLNLDQPAELETYDFSSFEMPEPEITAPSPSLVPEKSLEEVGEFDFNFDFDTPIVPSKEDAGDEFDLGVADLTDMDEFETKIDLAKAYMDMGDAVAAKSIAEEVLAKGSKAQKAAAQALLDELQ